MNQMTLRQIPDRVEDRIRKLSAKNNESINKTTLKLLMKATGCDSSKRKKRDLAKLAGTWSTKDAREFEETVKIFDQVDEELWK